MAKRLGNLTMTTPDLKSVYKARHLPKWTTHLTRRTLAMFMSFRLHHATSVSIHSESEGLGDRKTEIVSSIPESAYRKTLNK